MEKDILKVRMTVLDKMKKLKGGEFPAWYENLPGYLQEAYKREFNKLQSKYEK
jgi:hypothetical protein